MHPITYQCMNMLIHDPVIFTSLVWTEVSFRRNLFLAPTPPFLLLSSEMHFFPGLLDKTDSLIHLLEQNSRFLGRLRFFLLFQEMAKPISA